jgi:hypothetical protein
VPKVWTCPACGTRNSVDETECSQCGRWASVFDLDATVDVDETGAVDVSEEEWRPIEVDEQAREPVVPSGPRPTVGEAARTVLDALREDRVGEPEGEAEAQPNRSRSVVKWLVIGLALLWFVLVPLLDSLS